MVLYLAKVILHTRTFLQQILEVQILFVGHILQAILAMDLFARFVELSTHGVIDKISWKTSCFTLIAFLLLHPGDQEDLCDDDAPEDAPDSQDAFESIDLDQIS
jgi:hypothetical protein